MRAYRFAGIGLVQHLVQYLVHGKSGCLALVAYLVAGMKYAY